MALKLPLPAPGRRWNVIAFACSILPCLANVLGEEVGNVFHRRIMPSDQAQPQLVFHRVQCMHPAFARPGGRGDIRNVQEEQDLGQWHVFGVEQAGLGRVCAVGEQKCIIQLPTLADRAFPAAAGMRKRRGSSGIYGASFAGRHIPSLTTYWLTVIGLGRVVASGDAGFVVSCLRIPHPAPLRLIFVLTKDRRSTQKLFCLTSLLRAEDVFSDVTFPKAVSTKFQYYM